MLYVFSDAIFTLAIAGCLDNSGYLRVKCNKKMRLVHHIIYEMEIGPIPDGMQVDHIDRNRLNNYPSNFRLVTNAINCRNQSKRITNTSGVTGVYWHTRDKIWAAHINDNGKQEAITAGKEAEKLLGYHINHGAS
jgi:hypothetical protein